MKSFAEYVEMREGVLSQVRGYFNKGNQANNKLELDARNALKAVIKNLANSSDPKLKYLYSGGYAHELYKIRQFIIANRTQPQAQQQPQQTQESIGQAIGNWAGQGGLLGAAWNKMTRSKEMVQHNELENKAIKALQALADRVNYEKGELYYSGYGSRIQWYVNWLKKAQAFNNTNMGVPDESPPEDYISYRRVQNPQLRSKRVSAPGQQLPGQQQTPRSGRWA